MRNSQNGMIAEVCKIYKLLGMMSYCLLTACRAEYTGCSPVLSLEGLKVQFPVSLIPILATIYNIS